MVRSKKNAKLKRDRQILVLQKKKIGRSLNQTSGGTYVPNEGDAPYPPYQALDWPTFMCCLCLLLHVLPSCLQILSIIICGIYIYYNIWTDMYILDKNVNSSKSRSEVCKYIWFLLFFWMKSIYNFCREYNDKWWWSNLEW